MIIFSNKIIPKKIVVKCGMAAVLVCAPAVHAMTPMHEGKIPQIQAAKINRACDQYEQYLSRTNQAYCVALGLAAVGTAYSSYRLYKWWHDEPDVDQQPASSRSAAPVTATQHAQPTSLAPAEVRAASEEHQSDSSSPMPQDPATTDEHPVPLVAQTVENPTSSGAEQQPADQPHAPAQSAAWWRPIFSAQTYIDYMSWGVKKSAHELAIGIPALVATGLSQSLGLPILRKISDFALRTHTIVWFVERRTNLNQGLEHLLFTTYEFSHIAAQAEYQPDAMQDFMKNLYHANGLLLRETEKVLGYLTYLIHNISDDEYALDNIGYGHPFTDKKYSRRLLDKVTEHVNAVSVLIHTIEKDTVTQLQVKELVAAIYQHIRWFGQYVEQIKAVEHSLDRVEDVPRPAISLTHKMYSINEYILHLQESRMSSHV